MKTVLYEAFGGPLQVASAADPVLKPHGVIVQVRASGICRSDWHGWMGHDPSIRLPHVPGHMRQAWSARLAEKWPKWKTRDRITVPFVLGWLKASSRR